jgi:DNA-binding response OmpR family regulator
MSMILIVEDEPLVAFSLADDLWQRLAIKAVFATSIADAERLLPSQDILFALLDINVGAETSFDLARRLKTGGVPFAFTSGANRSVIPGDLQNEVFFGKPCDVSEVAGLIAASEAGRKRRHK